MINLSIFSTYFCWAKALMISICTSLKKITLRQAISDYNNGMITLCEFHFQMNEASLYKQDLLKLTKIITVAVIPLSSAHCIAQHPNLILTMTLYYFNFIILLLYILISNKLGRSGWIWQFFIFVFNIFILYIEQSYTVIKKYGLSSLYCRMKSFKNIAALGKWRNGYQNTDTAAFLAFFFLSCFNIFSFFLLPCSKLCFIFSLL